MTLQKTIRTIYPPKASNSFLAELVSEDFSTFRKDKGFLSTPRAVAFRKYILELPDSFFYENRAGYRKMYVKAERIINNCLSEYEKMDSISPVI